MRWLKTKMKELILLRGQSCFVDEADYVWLSGFKWRYIGIKTKSGALYEYVARTKRVDGKYKQIYMHTQITDCPKGMKVDHINHNGLDNRRSNLRVCTHSENMRNRKMSANNTSGFKGVYKHTSRRNQYYTSITVGRERIKDGPFDNILDAVLCYDNYARRIFGEFAVTNKDLGLL